MTIPVPVTRGIGPADAREKFAHEMPIPATVETSEGPVAVLAEPQLMPGGVCRWHVAKPIFVRVGGQPVKAKLTVVVSVEGSRDWPRG